MDLQGSSCRSDVKVCKITSTHTQNAAISIKLCTASDVDTYTDLANVSLTPAVQK